MSRKYISVSKDGVSMSCVIFAVSFKIVAVETVVLKQITFKGYN